MRPARVTKERIGARVRGVGHVRAGLKAGSGPSILARRRQPRRRHPVGALRWYKRAQRMRACARNRKEMSMSKGCLAGVIALVGSHLGAALCRGLARPSGEKTRRGPSRGDGLAAVQDRHQGRQEGAVDAAAEGRRARSRSTACRPAARASTTPPPPARSSCATTRTSRSPASATSPTPARTQGGGAPDHLRLQRRPGLLLAVAAHGRAGTRSASWSPTRRPTPAGPYRTVDNEYGVLDKSDLVMIDPVGTGLSATRSAITRTRSSGASIRTSTRSAASSRST